MPNVAIVFRRSHDRLFDVTPDQHHPQLHAADHAPLATDDVHSYLVLGSFLPANRPHTDLTGIGPDQHHSQLHAADHAPGSPDDVHSHLVLGSFLPANRGHDALSGIGPNQHHTKVHASEHAPGGVDDVHGYLNLLFFPTANREHGDLTAIGAEDHQQQFGAAGDYFVIPTIIDHEERSFTNTTWAYVYWLRAPVAVQSAIAGTSYTWRFVAVMKAEMGYTAYARVHLWTGGGVDLGTYGEISTTTISYNTIRSATFSLAAIPERAEVEVMCTGGTNYIGGAALEYQTTIT